MRWFWIVVLLAGCKATNNFTFTYQPVAGTEVSYRLTLEPDEQSDIHRSHTLESE